jgi:hypothetical protein
VAEFVEPADGETVLILYLRAMLAMQPGFDSVAVLGAMDAESPDYEPPAEAVTVRATGGVPRDVLVANLLLTITAWGAGPDDDMRASDIARRAAGLILYAGRKGWMGETVVNDVTALSLPYKDSDPITSRARYSATFAVSMRGQIVNA